MRLRWGTCTVAVVATAVMALWACNDSGGPSSPSSSFQPAETPSLGSSTTGTPTSNPTPAPADDGRQFTILNGSEVARRADCRGNTAGWFLPDGYDITVRIDKRLDDEYRFVSNVFWSPEIGCAPTTDQPGRGSSWVRDGKFLKASFEPSKACGRYQWDLKAINVTTGEELNVFYGVLNTGNETCAPPPPPPPPPQDPTCRDYEDEKPSEPTIEGEPSVDVSATQVEVSQGSIVADSFSPNLPLTVDRPEYGQEAGEWSFTAYRNVPYGPENLECSVPVEREFSGPVRPQACEPEWIEQEPEYDYGEWGECKSGRDEEEDFLSSFSQTNNEPPTTTCEGTKKRRVKKTIKEVNSCTQEVRVKDVQFSEQTAECEYQCLAELCHTENKKYCNIFGGDCQNKSDFTHFVKKWKCQNVPPGVPGHYPNHFDANGHDDFFGSCSVQKCYDITN